MEKKKDLGQILQSYLGMTPKDKGADNWHELQAMAEEEINDLINEEKRELTEQVKVMSTALKTIADWNLPETGEFWDEAKTRKISYEHNYGSNGARDYMRTIAQQALETTELKP